jgi:hypothetical protein
MKTKKPWKIADIKRERYLNNTSLYSHDEKRFAFDILGKEPSDLEYCIITSVREIIANEASIPIEYVRPDVECRIYAEFMGPNTFWGYYLQPLMGVIGFDPITFLAKLENNLELKTGHVIFLKNNAYKVLSMFDKKEHNVKLWIQELIKTVEIE